MRRGQRLLFLEVTGAYVDKRGRFDTSNLKLRATGVRFKDLSRSDQAFIRRSLKKVG